MATNVRDPQMRDEIHDEIHDDMPDDMPVTAPASTVRPMGGSGVAVYDRNPAQPIDPALRPAAPPSPVDPAAPSPAGDPMLVEPRPTGSIIAWFIGAVLLIVLAYFVLQMLF